MTSIPVEHEIDAGEHGAGGTGVQGEPSPSPDPPAPRRPVRSLLISLGALIAAVAFVVFGVLPEAHTPVTYRFTVPLGTARALAAGANVSVFPERLVINKGDIIDLVNRDDHADEVGPFFVAAFGELRQSVNQAGTFSGTCTLHRSGRVVIVVR
ncbi:MAG: hypothetical protein ACRDZ8_00630 [Acidimicrobiales bacterium]